MKCTKCGEHAEGMVTYFSLATMMPVFICSRCQAKDMARQYKSIKKVEKHLAEFEEMAEKYEGMIRDQPLVPKIPDELSGVAMTPLTIYKSILYCIVELKARRLELITSKDSVERLEWELKKSVQAEDYERAAELRDKINQAKDE